MKPSLLDYPRAAWVLARLLVVTRFRFRGPYWTWRWHTAFGRGVPRRRDLLRAMVEYGSWASRMR